jgi:hypothetical protein
MLPSGGFFPWLWLIEEKTRFWCSRIHQRNVIRWELIAHGERIYQRIGYFAGNYQLMDQKYIGGMGPPGITSS